MEEAELDREMAAHLQRIAREVFLLMAEIELVPCAALAEQRTPVVARLCYRSSPGLELELLCESSLAVAAAQRLMSFDCVPDEASDIVRESVGEMANMVGGNFHSILSPGAPLDTTPVLTETTSEGRRVRIESFLGGLQGRLRLRLTEAV